MASWLQKLISNRGLMRPARAFKRGLVLRRYGRHAGARRRSGAAVGRRGRMRDLLELAGAGAGYVLRGPESLRYFARGYRYSLQLVPPTLSDPLAVPMVAPSPLEAWFDAHTEGLPLFKRRHYFAIYHHHLARFRGQPVHIVEIGVRGGGSLEMWRDYFGPEARVSGIDIDPACKEHESEGIEIFIGDQADPHFWARFLERLSSIDIVVDDGGHRPHQQAVTLERLLPHIRPGGVYICEDIGGSFQPFHSFLDGLSRPLSAIGVPERPTPPNPLHQHVASVHHYPLIAVIEKPPAVPRAFQAERRGAAHTSALGRA
jgi:methyltransferase family protein